MVIFSSALRNSKRFNTEDTKVLGVTRAKPPGPQRTQRSCAGLSLCSQCVGDHRQRGTEVLCVLCVKAFGQQRAQSRGMGVSPMNTAGTAVPRPMARLNCCRGETRATKPQPPGRFLPSNVFNNIASSFFPQIRVFNNFSASFLGSFRFVFGARYFVFNNFSGSFFKNRVFLSHARQIPLAGRPIPRVFGWPGSE